MRILKTREELRSAMVVHQRQSVLLASEAKRKWWLWPGRRAELRVLARIEDAIANELLDALYMHQT